MTFFILLVTNLIIAVVIYLLLVIKLERMSSSFHETKMRKEMDDVLNEFNAAAERNINILDNRINSMKKLMEQTDQYKSLDVTHYDEKVNKRNEKIDDLDLKMKEDRREIFDIDSFKRQKDTIVDKMKSGISSIIDSKKINSADKMETGSILDVKLDKNYDDLLLDIADIEEQSKTVKNKKEKISNQDYLKNSFDKTADRYTLVLDLFKDGHPVELLSKYSGIPEGEIKLIVNLNRSQG